MVRRLSMYGEFYSVCVVKSRMRRREREGEKEAEADPGGRKRHQNLEKGSGFVGGKITGRDQFIFQLGHDNVSAEHHPSPQPSCGPSRSDAATRHRPQPRMLAWAPTGIHATCSIRFPPSPNGLPMSARPSGLRPGIAQSRRTVKHRPAGTGILLVSAEIAQTFELETTLGFGRRQGRLDLAAGKDFQRLGI